MDASNSAQMRPKPKPQSSVRACEACRSAKIRCQIGPQSGICKRCSDFKRECVFRTGPRTRRPKVAKGNAELPPPPGPSQTFSIDFSMPADEEPGTRLDEIREQHERYIDELFPSSAEEEEESSTMSSVAGPAFSFSNLNTPGSSVSGHSRPMGSLGIKPQFNLGSAEKLLHTFRAMLLSCPCIVLDEAVDVRSMARDSPFVLLAILASTSCSTSLQGHSLYDEEFRKVLGLKFVTGGERSLELLQGILVYCAWYPFHLRPKHRQAFQYLKMAAEIAHDLELDQEQTFASQFNTALTPEDFAGFRAFLACYYLASVFANSWSKTSSVPFTSWVAKCCDSLEQRSSLEADHILVWLIRFHHISDEMLTLQKSYKTSQDQTSYHRGLIRIGLETQLREWQSRIPTNLSLMPSIRMSSLYGDMYLVAAPLMSAFKARLSDAEVPIDPTRLMGTVHTLRAFFECVVTLPPGEMGNFSSADWGHLIMTTILAYRLSLPVDICPSFDASQARQILNFSSYLEQLCKEPESVDGGSTNRTDCCTAFRVVLQSLKTKFDKKVAAAEAEEELTRRARECPMFDGSLDEYITLWDGHGGPMDPSSYATSHSDSSGIMTAPIADMVPGPDQTKPLVFHDLWATMTLGWGGEDIPDLDRPGAQIDYGQM
ncbi:hypothetical protein BJ170DRAFT_304961 [Xylariales sp. AK1849]|nr:hypothetical protein BJ170DRAFT_304961 [Xylariales sp. AK1849]